jgi:hypothetical protein
VTFDSVLTSLFTELGERWLNELSPQETITDEAILRELALPTGTRTRICFFAVPRDLVRHYKEAIFPLARDAGFIPSAGDDAVSPAGNLVAVIASLVQRAEALVADLSGASPNVAIELGAAVARRRPPHIAVVLSDADRLPFDAALEDVFVVRRRPGEPYESSAAGFLWVDQLAAWFDSLTLSVEGDIFLEARRLLAERLYRPAVISATSALEVALRDRPEVYEGLITTKRYRTTPPLGALLEAAQRTGVIELHEFDDLRRLQQLRNQAVHSVEEIDGRVARPLLDRTLAIIERVRAG